MSGNPLYQESQQGQSLHDTLSRRQLLKRSQASFAGLAMSALAHQFSKAADPSALINPLAPKEPHLKPRAKSIIYLSMGGGPSQVDTFDYKPVLQKNDGKSADMVGGGTASRLTRKGKLWGSPWKFQRHGESGLPISELFTHLTQHADDLCLINSMHTDVSGHALASQMQFTGSFQFTRPSLGSWTIYGLGSESTDIPGFVSLRKNEYDGAFLPPYYQPTQLNFRKGVENIRNRKVKASDQQQQLDFLQQFDQIGASEHPAVEEAVNGLRSDYEMAFRMQASMPDVVNVRGEEASVLEDYGIKDKETQTFGTQCLIARRLVQQGVRFVQLGYSGWDHHHTLEENLPTSCATVDKPIAALLTDLKRLGLFEDTLVIWGGEFGRTPFAEEWTGSRQKGRDHNAVGYTTWLAGGGVKGGIRYGSTDELGSKAIENRVHLHDLHATVLHLMGLDHTKLTFRYGGRDFRLTDVHGEVVTDIIA